MDPLTAGLGIILKLLDIGIQQQMFSMEYAPKAQTFAGKIREALATGKPLDADYLQQQQAELDIEMEMLHKRADEAREEIRRRQEE